MQQQANTPSKVSTSGWALAIVATVYVAVLLYLSAFNHPHTDDYYLGTHINAHSFWGYQQFIYLHWGGRYSSNLMGALFANEGWLYKYYFIHTLLLMLMGILAVYYLLKTINQYWWYQAVKQQVSLILTAALLYVSAIAAMPEPSTAIYWFSSSITYQLSLIWLLLLFAILIQVIQQPLSIQKIRIYVALLLLTILCAGTNEVAALLEGWLFILFWILNKNKCSQYKLNGLVAITAIIYTSCLLVLCLAPGNKERLSIIQGRGLVTVVLVAIARIAYVFWCIWQNTLLWAFALGAFFTGLRLKHQIVVAQRGKTLLANLFILNSMLAIVLLMVMLPILYFSNGSWPERATNLLTAVAFGATIMIFIYAGFQYPANALQQWVEGRNSIRIVNIVVLVALLTNSFTKELFKSAIAAPMYSRVMKERTVKLQQAKKSKQNQVFLNSYSASFNQLYNQVYRQSQRATLAQWIQQKPSLLFVFDDLSDSAKIEVLQQYYGLRIQVKD